jgi:hypothetical protein
MRRCLTAQIYEHGKGIKKKKKKRKETKETASHTILRNSEAIVFKKMLILYADIIYSYE